MWEFDPATQPEILEKIKIFLGLGKKCGTGASPVLPVL